jgi:hypothetical protein
MRVLHLQNDDAGLELRQDAPGTRRFRVEIPNCMLYPTAYEVMMCIWDQGRTIDAVEGIANFSMIQSNVTRRTSPLTLHREAIFYAPSVWQELPVAHAEPA